MSQPRPDLLARTDNAVLEQLLDGRHSCRAFTQQTVPRSQIERLLSLAQRAPSWCNTQPWQVIVTEGAATGKFRNALSDHVAQGEAALAAPDVPMPVGYSGIHLARRREVGWMLYEAVGVERGDRAGSSRQAAENFRLFGAPHVAIITIDADQGAYAALDTGFYAASFLLAAESMGIAAIPQAAIATYSPFIRRYFDIPSNQHVLLGISFGFEDTSHPANSFRTPRAETKDVVRWVS